MIILHVASLREKGRQRCGRCGKNLIECRDVDGVLFQWEEGSTVAQFLGGVPPEGTEFAETSNCKEI